MALCSYGSSFLSIVRTALDTFFDAAQFDALLAQYSIFVIAPRRVITCEQPIVKAPGPPWLCLNAGPNACPNTGTSAPARGRMARRSQRLWGTGTDDSYGNIVVMATY